MWRADELGQISWGQTGVSNFAQRNLSASAVPRLCPSSPLPWSTILALIPASTPATAARSLARRLSVSILQPVRASARHSAPQWMKFFVINLVQERADRMRWRERAFDHPRSRWPWWSTRTLRLRRIDPFVLPVRWAAGGHQTHCVFTTIPISTSPPPQPLRRRRRPLRRRESFPFMLSSTSRPTDRLTERRQ